MILAFRDQFVPYVLDGSKTHSIRAGKRWREGMRVDLYEKSRQRKKFELKLSGGSKGCICHGDGLFGMKCTAKEHSVYEQVQVAGMRLLFRAPVLRVEQVTIDRFWDTGYSKSLIVAIHIDGQTLANDEAEAFAYRDGFRGREFPVRYPSLREMSEFWSREHGEQSTTFSGQLIHWDYEAREPK